MIEKFVHVQNVGRFVAPDFGGDPKRFAKLTVIYGENGRGKSTLAEILRSLSSGLPHTILEKKTTWGSAAPFVQLMVDGKIRTFKDGTWRDGTCPILIFDTTFVTSNIYAGHSIGLDQRRSLYEFLIGDDVVKLANEITRLTKEATDALRPVNEKQAALTALAEGITLEDFLALAADEKVEEKIENKREEIKQLTNAKMIQSADECLDIAFPNFDRSTLEELLTKSVAQLSREATALVVAHIENHMQGEAAAAKKWLREGTDFANGKDCPYCGQEVEGVASVRAFEEYFSQAYKTLQDGLDIVQKNVNLEFGVSAETAFTAQLQTNEARVTSWKEILRAKCPEWKTYTAPDYFKKLRALTERAVKAKKAEPLEPVVLLDEEKEVLQRYSDALLKVGDYNKQVAAMNAAIKTHKLGLKPEGLAPAQLEMRRLEKIQRRHGPATVKLVEEYKAAKAERKRLEDLKEEKRTAIGPKANSLLTQHQKRINEYLEKFGASFRVVRARAEIDKGKSSSEFALELGGKEVELDAPAGEPCFRSCLSDGDRRTLALAVFLSRLKGEATLADKCIVFDDPVMSLDAHRAQHVIEEIKQLSATARQVVVMSHQKFFLASLVAKHDWPDMRALKIARKGTRESTVEVWDYDRETENDFFQNFRRLIEFRDGTAKHGLLDVAKAMRPVLEGTMKMRYPLHLGVTAMLGGVLEKIAKAKADPTCPEAAAGLHLFSDATVAELDQLNIYAREFHHDQNGGKALVEPDDGVLASYVNRTIKFVQGPF